MTSSQRQRNEQEWQKAENWHGPKWIAFYVAPDDTRVWAPKRIRSMGWTLNFGQRAAWVWVVAMFLAAVAVGLLVGALAARRG